MTYGCISTVAPSKYVHFLDKTQETRLTRHDTRHHIKLYTDVSRVTRGGSGLLPLTVHPTFWWATAFGEEKGRTYRGIENYK